jgi:hypothetical protein
VKVAETGQQTRGQDEGRYLIIVVHGGRASLPAFCCEFTASRAQFIVVPTG